MAIGPIVRVRFPPSPTGWCHVGTARMALINYLFAKKRGGSIIFRSEDTDRERSKREYEEDIIEQLHWLGLSWDEFARQSERLPRHVKAIEKLLKEDTAYITEEESKREPGKTVRLVRLRNPGKSISFYDIVRGDITVDTSDLGDFVIARAPEDPLYHLAVVVDDAEMSITHVIRGEEHISNTPRQILIQEALGYSRPVYAHYPLFLDKERSKLSKRRGETAVREYREQGYLPEALLNFIGTLGWTPPSGREMFSLGEMIAEFELEALHRSAGVFDTEKLRWFNRQYVERMNMTDFATYIDLKLESALSTRGFEIDVLTRARLLPLLRERVHVSGDVERMVAEGEFDFFLREPLLQASAIPNKGSDAPTAARHLAFAESALARIAEADWSPETIKEALWDYTARESRGDVLWPLRYALSGRQKSPDPFTIAAIVGKKTALERIERARKQVSAV